MPGLFIMEKLADYCVFVGIYCHQNICCGKSSIPWNVLWERSILTELRSVKRVLLISWNHRSAHVYVRSIPWQSSRIFPLMLAFVTSYNSNGKHHSYPLYDDAEHTDRIVHKLELIWSQYIIVPQSMAQPSNQNHWDVCSANHGGRVSLANEWTRPWLLFRMNERVLQEYGKKKAENHSGRALVKQAGKMFRSPASSARFSHTEHRAPSLWTNKHQRMEEKEKD